VSVTEWKRAAAYRAVEFIEPGMVVGLGHGSTTAFAIERLAERLAQGALSSVVGIPCSADVARTAKRLGIPLATLDEHPVVDLTIDGADEVDSQMNLIKGGGGALLREKLVAMATTREIIVVDATKLSRHLGTTHPLPVEVAPATWRAEASYVESLGAQVSRRGSDSPFLTDQGNYILDCRFGPIDDVHELARALDARPEVAAHGLFLDLVSDLVVANDQGVHHFERGQDWTAAIGVDLPTT
jgi:ribose 5-phosphate isomerase A